jgi:hypothetical protein
MLLYVDNFAVDDDDDDDDVVVVVVVVADVNFVDNVVVRR